jgi:formylglycine-generating enzyme required for sulfatase activity
MQRRRLRMNARVLTSTLVAFGVLTAAGAAHAQCDKGCAHLWRNAKIRKIVKEDAKPCCRKGWMALLKKEAPGAWRAEVARRASVIRWIRIPGGTGKMGQDRKTKNPDIIAPYPLHDVTIKPFRMSQTEITVAQYRACVKAGKCTPPEEKSKCNWAERGRARHPVNCVTWEQARAFCAWAKGRLPSEAEWEYAARGGGREQVFPWGDDGKNRCKRRAVMPGVGCMPRHTAPVCSKPAGNTRHGLCDMAGNVHEWIEDCFHRNYNGAPTDGSAWTKDCMYPPKKDGGRKVIRGTGFTGGSGNVYDRGNAPPKRAYHGRGFRCVR